METKQEIEWRLVPGYKNYRVSNTGRVQSCLKLNGRRSAASSDNWKELKTTPGADGYPRVKLRADSGPHKAFKVHKLVMLVFVGPCPDNMQVRHLDDIKINNNISNLSYGTQFDNAADALKNGTRSMGIKRPDAILVDANILPIFELRIKGFKRKEIAGIFGVSESTIDGVLHRRKWKHVYISDEILAAVRSVRFNGKLVSS